MKEEKMNEIEILREKMKYYKKWYERSFLRVIFLHFIWTEIFWNEFMKMQKQNKRIIINIINWLHSKCF